MKINSNGLVNDILESYNHWAIAKKFAGERQTVQAFHSPEGINCLHFTDLTRINQLKNKTVVIDGLTESIHIDTYFKQYEKSNFYIIFSGGHWEEDKYKFENLNYKLIYFPYFLYSYKQFFTKMNYIQSYLENKYTFTYPKKYEFISTTGRKMPERSAFLEILLTNISYDNYIFKYAGKDIGCNSDLYDFSETNWEKYGAYKHLDSYEEYYLNISGTIPITLYNNANFNLILETDIDHHNSFFITEKTIKSLITGMPFVVLSTPYFLKNLKELGFMSYNSLWDESYDEETNFEKRCLKISKLCESLKDFDWKGNQQYLEYIGLKNQQLFYTQNKIMDKYFKNLEKHLSEINT